MLGLGDCSALASRSLFLYRELSEQFQQTYRPDKHDKADFSRCFSHLGRAGFFYYLLNLKVLLVLWSCAVLPVPVVLFIGGRSMKFIDYVILGTGFGAGTVGLRLAQAGKEVVFLERGRKWFGRNIPPADTASGARAFPEDADDHFLWARKASNPFRQRLGLYEMKQFAALQGLVASGVGGGSLIWANVVVKAHEEAFSAAWPKGTDLKSLERYYDYARPYLRPRATPALEASQLGGDLSQLLRAKRLQEAAGKLKASWQPLDVAVSFSDIDKAEPNGFGAALQKGCNMCGLCTAGCPQGAKNSVDLTYIAAAEALGAELRPLHEASFIEAVEGGYCIHVRKYAENGVAKPACVYARNVVIACGSFGSTELLLKSRAAGYLPALSPALGSRFSINGNVLGAALDPSGDGFLARTNDGPAVTSMIDFGNCVVEDIANPVWASGLVGKNQFLKVLRFLQIYFGVKVKPEQLKKIALDLLVYVGVGIDRSCGRLYLDRFGRLALNWPAIKSDAAIQAQYRVQAAIAESLGRTYLPDVFSTFGRAFTYHPLGGCPMGESGKTGVVNAFGAVFNYPGLYVADASIIPGALGRNPSFTICALAERCAERILAA